MKLMGHSSGVVGFALVLGKLGGGAVRRSYGECRSVPQSPKQLAETETLVLRNAASLVAGSAGHPDSNFISFRYPPNRTESVGSRLAG